MMLDFSKECREIERLVAASGGKAGLEVAMVLVEVLDRGMAEEQARIIRIIQQHGTNPLALVERIRRPVR
jgi:hypothetical protein